MSENRTEIADLGEFGLIKRVTKTFELNNKSSVLGIGDDAAVIRSEQKTQVVSTDLLVEGVHFDLAYVPLQHLGFKAVAVNVSDVAAMNAIPKQITVSIALSNRFSVEAVEALYAGIKSACAEYKVDLIGGDTSASNAGLVVSITIIGEVGEQDLVRRKGCSKGDIVCATGDFGAAYLGLQVLAREKEVYKTNPDMQPKLEEYQYLIERQLKPKARMDIVHELKERAIVPTSMIDVSDGLGSEVLHLEEENGHGLVVYEDKIPYEKETYETAVEFGVDPITCAMNGGEDYELLFTINQKDHDALKNVADISFIGYVGEANAKSKLVTRGGNVVEIEAQGWNHLKK